MQSNPPVHSVALITGAARRIGAAIARRLHAQGYDLALHFHHSAQDMHALHEELEQQRHDSVLVLDADLNEPAAPEALVTATLNRYGRLDALVNNASAFFPSSLDSTSVAQWNTLFAVNARAPFFLSQNAAPYLRESGGCIVNLTDIHAARPRPDVLAYACAKAALEALTRGLAVSLAPEVRVNAVAPGAILWPEGEMSDAQRQAMLARTPMGRIGSVQEIAEAVYWLLSGARYSTGEILHLDGGRHLT
ncbi:pteridine reductase [Oleiagrimonas sp.]|jgi:pteridine reductase|uniref:pteridine reductase n=1 Tax=Oleiagrimonas sp. TaxID=2010330 RepID=UPI002610E70D|nr:pteridine reductase [Oleiagrimonas sp.]MDA3914264.1 pteridine reductase [Oleiagrimonas sp.]